MNQIEKPNAVNDNKAESGAADPLASYGATDASPKKLTPAAKRALEEAEARRAKEKPLNLPKELDGRDGPEPTRYGDWEKDGIVSDF